MVKKFRRVNAAFTKEHGPTEARIVLQFDLTDHEGLTIEHWIDRLNACLRAEIATHHTEYYLSYFVVMDVMTK